MIIKKLSEVEKTKVQMDGAQHAYKQLPIGQADSTPSCSIRVFTLEPDGHTPYHTHPFEHLNYIIAGQGVLVKASGEECPLQKGDFALVLPDEKHQYKNTSDQDSFIMICAVPKEYE